MDHSSATSQVPADIGFGEILGTRMKASRSLTKFSTAGSSCPQLGSFQEICAIPFRRALKSREATEFSQEDRCKQNEKTVVGDQNIHCEVASKMLHDHMTVLGLDGLQVVGLKTS